MTRCHSNPPVASQQDGAQHFRQSHIHRIVRGECGAKVPHTRDQKIMRITIQRQVVEILESLTCSLLAESLLPYITP